MHVDRPRESGTSMVQWLLAVLALVALVLLLLTTTQSEPVGSSTPSRGHRAPQLQNGKGDGSRGERDGAARKGRLLLGPDIQNRQGRGTVVGFIRREVAAEPIPHARVVLSGTSRLGVSVEAKALTGPDGQFQFRDVPSGTTYKVTIVTPRGLKRILRNVQFEANGSRDLGEIWIGAPGKLQGRVMDMHGEPVSSAVLEVHRGSGSISEAFQSMDRTVQAYDQKVVPIASATTNINGQFQFPEVDPGPVMVVVRAPGFGQSMTSIVMTSSGAARGRVRINLLPRATVRGRLVDVNGKGLADAQVSLLPFGNHSAAAYGRRYVDTQADGVFEFESPPTDRTFSVVAVARSFPTTRFQVESWIGEQAFKMERGVRVKLRVVKGVEDTPVANALVMFTAGSANLSNLRGQTISVVRTDSQGEASFLGRSGKIHLVRISHPKWGTAVFAPSLRASNHNPVSLRGPKDVELKSPSTTFTFKLLKGVTLRGVVRNEDMEPIEGAKVFHSGFFGVASRAVTDSKGHYELPCEVVPEEGLVVSAPGYASAEPQLSEEDDVTSNHLNLDVTLARGSVVRGAVADLKGKPIQGVKVRVQTSQSRSFGALVSSALPSDAITDSRGRYEIHGVDASNAAFVMGRFEGFIDSKSQTFSISARSSSVAPALVMNRGVSLVVEVRSDGGIRIPGARVELTFAPTAEVKWGGDTVFVAGPHRECITDLNGKVIVANVPPGKVTILVESEAFARSWTHGQVARTEDGEPLRVEVILTPGYVFRGEVVDDKGVAVPHVCVSARQTKDKVGPAIAWTRTTDADGRFEFTKVPKDELLFTASSTSIILASRVVPWDQSFVTLQVKRDVERETRSTELRIEAIEQALRSFFKMDEKSGDYASARAFAEHVHELQTALHDLKTRGR